MLRISLGDQSYCCSEAGWRGRTWILSLPLFPMRRVFCHHYLSRCRIGHSLWRTLYLSPCLHVVVLLGRGCCSFLYWSLHLYNLGSSDSRSLFRLTRHRHWYVGFSLPFVPRFLFSFVSFPLLSFLLPLVSLLSLCFVGGHWCCSS